MNMSIFRRICIAVVSVVSQSNRTHFVISTTFVVVECDVVSSYRGRIAVVIYALQCRPTCNSLGQRGTELINYQLNDNFFSVFSSFI